MPKLFNRARMSTATTGTGTITLGSAATNFQTFAAAGVSDGDVVRYVLEDGADWEIGTGIYSAAGPTLTRAVSESSNAGSAINLSGNAEVFIDVAAEDFFVNDGNSTIIPPGGEILWPATENFPAGWADTQERLLSGTSERAIISNKLFPYAVSLFHTSLVSDFLGETYASVGSSGSVLEGFSDLITHTRASTATYVDSSGILQTAASGVPRVGHHIYDGSQWVNEGILHESEARTNLFLHSDMDTGWIKDAPNDDGTTFTKDYSNGPDGQQKMWRFNPNFVTDPGDADRLIRFYEGINSLAEDVITFSVFIKPVVATSTYPDGSGTTRDVYVGLYADKSNGRSFYNCNTLSWESIAAGHTVTDEDFGDGLRRISVSYTVVADDTSHNHFLSISNRPSRSFDPFPDGNEDIRFGYAQVEKGFTPSSYIPTAGSQVTRAADSMTIPAAKLPYDATNMSIAMEGRMTYADTDSFVESTQYAWSLSAVNFISASIDTVGSRTGQQEFFQREDTSGQDVVGSGNNYYSPGINVPFSIAAHHGSTFINGALDGTALTANTTPTALPDLSAADLDLGPFFMGTIRLFRMWSDDLGDSGIEEASS